MSVFQINNAIDAALNSRKVLRVAFYIRVSTSEQVSKENSLPAQKIALEQWCETNNAVCVGLYADEGKTAAKEIRKRKEIHRLLADIRDGKIDLVIFTRFDRFTRNPEEYFKMMETMNATGVQWKAINQPELDLNTDMGQTLILFYLGMGRQEIANISERIKATSAVRIQKGSPVTGAQCFPFGFTIGQDDRGNKIVIRDPEQEPVVWEYIHHYELKQSHRLAMEHCNDMFGLAIGYNSYRNMMKNTLMYGHYKGVDGYCKGYVTKERFDSWAVMNNKNVRVGKNRKTYIFTQLCVCGECGHRMSGTYTTSQTGELYYYYRCNYAKIDRQCNHLRAFSEKQIEQFLLERIKPEIERCIYEAEAEAAKPVVRTKVDIVKKLEKELDRLNYQYRKDRISEKEYDTEYEALVKKINEARAKEVAIANPVQRDLTSLREFLKQDIQSIYATLTREEKRTFWRGIIDSITLHPDKKIELKFL